MIPDASGESDAAGRCVPCLIC